jgi:hypothetical protein
LDRPTYLLEGLTVRRVVAVTVLCVAASAIVVGFFRNTFLDLMVSALCVGYIMMVLFTIAGNMRVAWPNRVTRQVLAVLVGSFLGTVLAGLVKGRGIADMFTERLAGITITMSLGIGFGWVAVAA